MFCLLDKTGAVASAFARPQPDLGAVEIADDDPRVVAFFTGATQAQLRDYAGAKQATSRDAGITVNVGTASAPQIVDVASNETGRTLLTGAIQLIGLASQTGQPAPSFSWVNNDGSALTLTSAQMMTMGYALGAYVQATYATLGTVMAAIANATITTTAGIDAASWPATAS